MFFALVVLPNQTCVTPYPYWVTQMISMDLSILRAEITRLKCSKWHLREVKLDEPAATWPIIEQG